MFRMKQAKSIRALRPQAIAFYRKCIRIVYKLVPAHQRTWYDYLRLKYDESKGEVDANKIKKMLKEAEEELEWVKTIIERSNKNETLP